MTVRTNWFMLFGWLIFDPSKASQFQLSVGRRRKVALHRQAAFFVSSLLFSPSFLVVLYQSTQRGFASQVSSLYSRYGTLKWLMPIEQGPSVILLSLGLLACLFVLTYLTLISQGPYNAYVGILTLGISAFGLFEYSPIIGIPILSGSLQALFLGTTLGVTLFGAQIILALTRHWSRVTDVLVGVVAFSLGAGPLRTLSLVGHVSNRHSSSEALFYTTYALLVGAGAILYLRNIHFSPLSRFYKFGTEQNQGEVVE